MWPFAGEVCQAQLKSNGSPCRLHTGITWGTLKKILMTGDQPQRFYSIVLRNILVIRVFKKCPHPHDCTAARVKKALPWLPWGRHYQNFSKQQTSVSVFSVETSEKLVLVLISVSLKKWYHKCPLQELSLEQQKPGINTSRFSMAPMKGHDQSSLPKSVSRGKVTLQMDL